MVNTVSSNAGIQARPASINLDVTPQRKPKLDIQTVPESKVRVEPAPGGSAGQGKGLKIDISA
ncbi:MULTISPECIES: hypothetical protein [Kordiimonas]|uniref:hypothetical protein n=1 Tax=Kordiimonas TaxID=288021 RepID=UPI001FF209F2|nr:MULTISPECIES: hypothetical protein [Kordiimonas]MCK0068687.1 hypothetical protein [Kordiimonas laminariae]UTW58042.1 hypothetical protein KFE96_14620 [Kordiimonas sp. SCSIO 12603]